MKYNFIDLYNSTVEEDKIYIIGAGIYGGLLQRYIMKNMPEKQLAYIDSNRSKQKTLINSVEVFPYEQLLNEDAQSCICLIPTAKQNINQVNKSKYNQVKQMNKDAKVCFVELASISGYSRDELIQNGREFFDSIFVEKKKKTCIDIQEIGVITHRLKPRAFAGGGPAKVVMTMESLLGNEHNSKKICYVFAQSDMQYLEPKYYGINAVEAVKFGREHASMNKNCSWICHDILTACGLAAEGAHYALVYHSQGEYVYEQECMGVPVSDEESHFLKRAELEAVKQADIVCFPSKGAEKFFWETFGNDIEIPKYQDWNPMYNTVLMDSVAQLKSIDKIEKDDDFITFLSIGQMTEAKGLDRIPTFLSELSKNINRKVRWVVVADGPLKTSVIESCELKSKENTNFVYFQFDRCVHEEINYLMSISDVYLMLHRVSIFDIATLEAMYFNKKIMLSDIEGNREYNINGNVFLISQQFTYDEITNYLSSNVDNRKIFEDNFSERLFIMRYKKLIDELIRRAKD